MGHRIRPTVITYSAGVTPQALDLPAGIAFNAGTDYWRLKWKGKLHEARTGIYGLFGANQTSTSNGFAFNFGSAGDGLFNLNRGGSLVFASAAGYIKRDNSKDYEYEVEHLATGELYYRRDGSVIQSTTYTANSPFTGTQVLNSLLRRVTIPSTGIVDLELEYFEYQFQNNPTVRYSGAGIISPSNRFPKVGGDGSDDLIQTATWPADNSEWIYYDSGIGLTKDFVVSVGVQALNAAGFTKRAIVTAVEGALASVGAAFAKRSAMAASEAVTASDSASSKKVGLQPVAETVQAADNASAKKVGKMPLSESGQAAISSAFTKRGNHPVAETALVTESLAFAKVAKLVASESVSAAVTSVYKKVSGFAVSEGAQASPVSDNDKVGFHPVSEAGTVTIVATFIRKGLGLEVQEALTASVTAALSKVGRMAIQISALTSTGAAVAKIASKPVAESVLTTDDAGFKKVGRGAVAEQVLASMSASATKIARQVVAASAQAGVSATTTKVGIESVTEAVGFANSVVMRKIGEEMVAEGATAAVSAVLKKYGRVAIVEQVEAGVSATFYQHFEGIMQLSEVVLAGFDLSMVKVGASPVHAGAMASTEGELVKVGTLIVAEYSLADSRVVMVDAEIPVYIARVSGSGSSPVLTGVGSKPVIYGRSKK